MIRFLGAGLVVLAAGSVGFGYARQVKLQCEQMRGLCWALDYMQSEMSSRLTPLTEIFILLSSCRQKDVALFFKACAGALSKSPGCTLPLAFQRGFQVSNALCPGEKSRQALGNLSLSLGRFELEAQLAALEAAKRQITDELLELESQKRARCRSYETIGLCAGLALAVIFL